MEKGVAVHLKNLNVLHSKCFVPSLVEIGPVILEKKRKFVKSLWTDGLPTVDIESERLI